MIFNISPHARHGYFGEGGSIQSLAPQGGPACGPGLPSFRWFLFIFIVQFEFFDAPIMIRRAENGSEQKTDAAHEAGDQFWAGQAGVIFAQPALVFPETQLDETLGRH